jgi:hypothetical protein
MSLFNGLGSVSEGDKQMKAATKLCQPSLLAMRMTADWEAATPLFEKAALNYKQAKALEKAIEAYERAAQGQERLNSPWHAAKHLEQARNCCGRTALASNSQVVVSAHTLPQRRFTRTSTR